MTYTDGREILVGDRVFIEGSTPGVIVDVVSAERTSEVNVDEPGVMIKSAPFGLLYLPASMFEELQFEARAAHG